MTANEEAAFRSGTHRQTFRYNHATKVCIRCKRTRSLGQFKGGEDVCLRCLLNKKHG